MSGNESAIFEIVDGDVARVVVEDAYYHSALAVRFLFVVFVSAFVVEVVDGAEVYFVYVVEVYAFAGD